MRLLAEKYNLNIALSENRVTLLTLENPRVFSGLISDIITGINDDGENVILSDNDKELNLSKSIDFIANPLTVDCNNRRVLGKLYQEIVGNVYPEEISGLNGHIVSFLDSALLRIPYQLDFSLELDLEGLLKLYSVSVLHDGSSYVDNFVSYLKVTSSVLRTKVYVVLNLKQYYTDEELHNIYKEAIYQKINLIVIEGVQSSHLEEEKHYIIDKDTCVIEPLD